MGKVSPQIWLQAPRHSGARLFVCLTAIAIVLVATAVATAFPPAVALATLVLSALAPLLAVRIAHLRQLADQNSRAAVLQKEIASALEHAPDCVFILDTDCRIRYLNTTAAKSLGRQPEDLIDTPFTDLTPEESRQSLRRHITEAIRDESVQTPITLIRTGHLPLPLEAHCGAFLSGGQRLVYMAARDVTARLETVNREFERRKWESLRAVAGGMAHDFNNLLTTMMGNASLARGLLPEDHYAAQCMRNVEQAGEQSAELISLMLAATGQFPSRSESIRLDALARHARNAGWVQPNIHIHVEVEPDAFGAPQRALSTILKSLITNAAESYEGSPGTVRVRIGFEHRHEAWQSGFEEGTLPPLPCLLVRVEDEGPGMTREVLARAFDPFFSTRFTGRGLGLPAVRGLARANKALLRLRTGPDQGTTVEVWLPDYRPSSTSSALARSS